MLLAMLMMGCEDATPNWDLMAPFGGVDEVAAAQQPPAQAASMTDSEPDAEMPIDGADTESDDGFDDPWGPNSGEEEEDVVAEPEPEPEPEPAPELAGTPVMPSVGAGGGAVHPFGLPDSAAWGVRLLGTLSNAQPPRAALGLPDGTEVVVAPGSMLPSVGMVVITVGQDVVQVARVSPAGDHAEVEMINLVAQYTHSPAGQ